ncbi:MAG: hypothetical protein AAF957_16760 [Planctomycetota bacterium]
MTDSHAQRSHWLLRLSAVLWIVWGLVHVFAGVITLVKISAGEDAKAIHGITSRVDLATLQIDYPPAAMAILSQHGFNLAWFGVVTFLCAFWVWRGQRLAVYLAALVGGLADLGYFLYIDLGGYATPPGPQMTYICAAAILTGLAGLRAAGRIG